MIEKVRIMKFLPAKLICFLSLIFLHLSLLFWTQYTAWPEMLIYPYLLKRGFLFYIDIIQPYFPTLPYILWSVYSFFGISITSLRIFSYATILTTDILFFFIGKKLSFRLPLYILFLIYTTLQVFLDGNSLWFDHFVVPFLLSSFYFHIQYNKTNKQHYLYMCAFFLGISFIVKQTVVWFLFAFLGNLLLHKKYKEVLVALCVLSLPFLLLILLFPNQRMEYWAVYYPFFFMVKSSGYILYPTFRQLLICLFIFSPLIFLIFSKQTRFISLWILAGMGFAWPRFAYFHLQPALPFLILGIGQLLSKVKKEHLFIIVGYFVVLLLIFSKFLSQSLGKPVRFFENDVYETADSLHDFISQTEPVFFYNDMGNVMVAGGFLPIKPWAATFPWYMEVPGVQESIVNQLEMQRIRHIVLVPFGDEGTYVPGSYRPQKIETYITSNYTPKTKVGSYLLLERN